MALFGPIVNVCPSANAVPTFIEPDVDSTDTVEEESISSDPTFISRAPLVVISISLELP